MLTSIGCSSTGTRALLALGNCMRMLHRQMCGRNTHICEMKMKKAKREKNVLRSEKADVRFQPAYMKK